jgi:hypothetical protein
MYLGFLNISVKGTEILIFDISFRRLKGGVGLSTMIRSFFTSSFCKYFSLGMPYLGISFSLERLSLGRSLHAGFCWTTSFLGRFLIGWIAKV